MEEFKPLAKSGPNRLPWIYYEMLVNLVNEIHKEEDIEKIRQKTVICVFLSLSLIETFINIYFRLFAEKINDANKRIQLIEEINKRGIDWKIDNWPVLQKIDYGQGIGQKFQNLKKLRNDLVHYKPTYERVEVPGFAMEGLTDTAVYDFLNKDDAFNFLETAENFIGEIICIGDGMTKDLIKHSLHFWLGRVPR